MYSVEIDKSKRLLVISAAGDVTKKEMKDAAKKVRNLLREAETGLHALTDLRWMNSMDPGAAPHIAEIMDALAEKQVASVTRVVPDPHKDIGFNILSKFHYDSNMKIFTFETLADALQSLAGN
jgi:hypothetical protein